MCVFLVEPESTSLSAKQRLAWTSMHREKKERRSLETIENNEN